MIAHAPTRWTRIVLSVVIALLLAAFAIKPDVMLTMLTNSAARENWKVRWNVDTILLMEELKKSTQKYAAAQAAAQATEDRYEAAIARGTA